MKVHPKLLARMPRAVQAWQASGITPARGLRASATGTELLIYDVIGDPWDGVTARDVAGFLAEVPPGPLTVRINSPGGYTDDGMAIYNMLAQRGDVTTVVDGVAASAASIVLMAGGKRQAYASSLVMIHRSWTVTIGNEDDMASALDILRKTDGMMADIYTGRGSQTVEEYAAAMRAETYYSGAEALAAGLVDQVIEHPEPPKPAARADTAEIQRRLALLRLAERA
nr:head maturation protease, ClpP-related [uncultured Roseococcus sp.]